MVPVTGAVHGRMQPQAPMQPAPVAFPAGMMAAPRPQVQYACLGQPMQPAGMVVRQVGSQPMAMQPLPTMPTAAPIQAPMLSQPVLAGHSQVPGVAQQVAPFQGQVSFQVPPPPPVQLQPPLQLPQMVPKELQNELAAKDKQLGDLTAYAATLQQQLKEQQAAYAEREEKEKAEREREIAARSSQAGVPQGPSPEEVELEEMRKQFAAMAVEGQAIRDDIAKAADLAHQLNSWFESNASKMKVQDGWTSPSAYVESSTRELREQMELVMPMWVQVQEILALEDPASQMMPATTWEVDMSRRPAASSPADASSGAQTSPNVMARPYGSKELPTAIV
mmetsp:Transcript_52488/g.97172  ORF Transcript_52488/g.97172 Transcript_52488/m.97172 type:complete len:335 (-) Transcript_52488:56-1060(-)